MGRHSPIGSTQGFTYGKQAGRTDGDTVSRYVTHEDDPRPNTVMAEKLLAALHKGPASRDDASD